MEKIILNIPHSSTFFPDMEGFNAELISNEINILTDWYTKQIFDSNLVESKIADFSRIYCDIERFPDELESMFIKGMGIVYTHTDSGEQLRNISETKKQEIINNYYLPYHEDLSKKVFEKLNKYDNCLIIDCHSFNNIPTNRDIDQAPNRPDICIGSDSFHTPPDLVEFLATYFTGLGYEVRVNSPYSGSLVPIHFYNKDSRVQSVMIEINKRLYLDANNQPVEDNIKKLHSEIEKIYRMI